MKLVIRNVTFSYRSTPALKDICFEVKKGELVSLIGPNGSGKTTLLKCIDGILKPHRGSVFVDGKGVSNMSLKEISKLMGYVPQNVSTASFPFTVFDIVLAGRRPHIGWSVGDEDVAVVTNILNYMGIGHLATRYFSELSGGEQQKVMIARALVQLPQALLLDEPTSNLDIRHQLEVLQMLNHLCKEMGLSVIAAMHDLNLASRFSDKMIMLKDGCIFAAGAPEEVITADNIMAVYGVRAHVSLTEDGRPHVIPIEPVDMKGLRETPYKIGYVLGK